ncbi:MAG: SRPBCC family protein [Candidatus Izemoplasmatales bacterium]
MKLKYTCEIVINKDIHSVTKKMIDYESMKKWQKSLLTFKTIKGIPGQEKSLTKLYFDNDMIMTETIEKNLLPNRLIQVYEVTGVWNRCVNDFLDLKGQTKWILETEFIIKKDIDLPVDAFKKKTLRAMEDFKDFIESQ